MLKHKKDSFLLEQKATYVTEVPISPATIDNSQKVTFRKTLISRNKRHSSSLITITWFLLFIVRFELCYSSTSTRRSLEFERARSANEPSRRLVAEWAWLRPGQSISRSREKVTRQLSNLAVTSRDDAIFLRGLRIRWQNLIFAHPRQFWCYWHGERSPVCGVPLCWTRNIYLLLFVIALALMVVR